MQDAIFIMSQTFVSLSLWCAFVSYHVPVSSYITNVLTYRHIFRHRRETKVQPVAHEHFSWYSQRSIQEPRTKLMKKHG